ncbi:MAG: hypothetical protein LBV30_04285 [Propionibacteriaceae bacterium]|nr:hypothetical protein [Propionibacteriaceae bacterium]
MGPSHTNTLKMIRRRALTAGAMLAVLTFITGCTNEQADLPSSDDLTRPSSSGSSLPGTGSATPASDGASPTGGASTSPDIAYDLVTRAYNFQTCLADADISTSLEPGGGKVEGLVLVSFSGSPYGRVFYNDGNGHGDIAGQSGGMDQASQADRDRLMSAEFQDGQAHLEIDGADHSADWSQCLAETGYVYMEALEPKPVGISAEYVMSVVEGNNAWAACAREHGFPNITDSVMPSDFYNWDTWPQVSIPLSTEPVALAQLMLDCPNYDATAADRLASWYAEHPDEFPPEELLVSVKANIQIDTSSVTDVEERWVGYGNGVTAQPPDQVRAGVLDCIVQAAVKGAMMPNVDNMSVEQCYDRG